MDRYVRRRPGLGPRESIGLEAQTRKQGREPAFLRFPTWMWRNREVQEFTKWLRALYKGKYPKTEVVRFYGMNLHSLGGSMDAVLEYLEHIDLQIAEKVGERYQGLRMWAEEPHQ